MKRWGEAGAPRRREARRRLPRRRRRRRRPATWGPVRVCNLLPPEAGCFLWVSVPPSGNDLDVGCVILGLRNRAQYYFGFFSMGCGLFGLFSKDIDCSQRSVPTFAQPYHERPGQIWSDLRPPRKQPAGTELLLVEKLQGCNCPSASAKTAICRCTLPMLLQRRTSARTHTYVYAPVPVSTNEDSDQSTSRQRQG